MLRQNAVFGLVALGLVPLLCMVLVTGCPVPPVLECTGDADCAQGQVCENGVCVDAPTPECETDADCTAGQMCVDGACVEGTPGPLHKTFISDYEGTQTCLVCHSEDAAHVMESGHWNWSGVVDDIAGLEGQTHGKVDLLNNY